MIELRFSYNIRKMSSLKNAFSELESTGNQSIRKGVLEAGQILTRFLLARFLRLSRSGGGGEWPDILESTKQRKDSTDVLWETSRIYHSIKTKESSKIGKISVLVSDPQKHPKSRLSVEQLAIVHHRGLGVVPSRLIFPKNTSGVSLQTISDMGLAIRAGYRNAIRNAG